MLLRPSCGLRRFLIADSIASATAGLTAATLADLLKAPLGLSADLLQYAGLGLLALSVLIAYAASELAPAYTAGRAPLVEGGPGGLVEGFLIRGA